MPVEPGLGKDVIVENAHSVWIIDGEKRVGANVVIGKEKWEEYRNGVRCLRCHGVQSQAFPDVCEARDLSGSWRCNFRIKDDQLRYLENETDERWYGPSPTDDFDYEQENWKPSDSRIWLPGDN